MKWSSVILFCVPFTSKILQSELSLNPAALPNVAFAFKKLPICTSMQKIFGNALLSLISEISDKHNFLKISIISVLPMCLYNFPSVLKYCVERKNYPSMSFRIFDTIKQYFQQTKNLQIYYRYFN